jgi:hypothetical protein
MHIKNKIKMVHSIDIVYLPYSPLLEVKKLRLSNIGQTYYNIGHTYYRVDHQPSNKDRKRVNGSRGRFLVRTVGDIFVSMGEYALDAKNAEALLFVNMEKNALNASTISSMQSSMAGMEPEESFVTTLCQERRRIWCIPS